MAHTYRGYEIYRCTQIGLGRCDGRGWHVRTYHERSGMPWSEADSSKHATLADAKRHIDSWPSAN